jgi:predicted transposase YbfD/YdcC
MMISECRYVLSVAFRKSSIMAEIQFDNVDSILSCFEDLKDPRSHINRQHVFGDLLVICITAIPELLDNIEIKGAVVTIDAAGCQREIAKRIIDGGGQYVLSLKGNQGKLHDAVTDYIAKHMENDFADIKARRYAETLEGHGRVDVITYYQMCAPKTLVNLDKWKGLRTIGVAIRQSESGSKSSTEVRFFIASIPLGVKRLARYVRGPWAIENTPGLVS